MASATELTKGGSVPLAAFMGFFAAIRRNGPRVEMGEKVPWISTSTTSPKTGTRAPIRFVTVDALVYASFSASTRFQFCAGDKKQRRLGSGTERGGDPMLCENMEKHIGQTCFAIVVAWLWRHVWWWPQAGRRQVVAAEGAKPKVPFIRQYPPQSLCFSAAFDAKSRRQGTCLSPTKLDGSPLPIPHACEKQAQICCWPRAGTAADALVARPSDAGAGLKTGKLGPWGAGRFLVLVMNAGGNQAS